GDPLARFMVRFEIEDRTKCTVFIALDAEVQRLVGKIAAQLIGTPEKTVTVTVLSGFSKVLKRPLNFQIALRPFHRIHRVATDFAVTRIYQSVVDVGLGTN
ncbi:hypothetical protein MKX01_020434, partial [Papaver californicum]